MILVYHKEKDIIFQLYLNISETMSTLEDEYQFHVIRSFVSISFFTYHNKIIV